MSFSHETYLNANFVHMLFPLFTGVAVLIWGIYASIFQSIRSWKKEGTLWAVFDKVLSGMLPVVVGSLVIYTFATPMLRDGSFHLPFETEADAVICTGVVEQIEDRSVGNPFTRFSIDEDPGYSWGKYVTINGIRYTVVQWEGIAVGERVTISYLPKSRCILSYSVSTGDGQEVIWEQTALCVDEFLSLQGAALPAALLQT